MAFNTMDDTVASFRGVMTLTMIGVARQARRLSNERRDVVVLGTLGRLCGVGTAVAAVL